MRASLIPLLLTLALNGCWVELVVPEGGEVAAQSGDYACAAGNTCPIEVDDLLFDETFVATPKPGFAFRGWRERERGFCSRNAGPCRLFTAPLELVGATAVLDSDDVFYLEPIFEQFSANTVTAGYHADLPMTHEGLQREYDLYVPASYDGTQAFPLVMAMHGFTQHRVGHRTQGGFDTLAETENFIVVYPQGIGNSWNIGPCCSPASDSGNNDTGFLHALLAKIKSEAIIDETRVYATGWSNGGGIAALAACEAADQFSAMALFASMTQIGSACSPSRPIAVLSLHAENDIRVPYRGGTFFGITPVEDQLAILDFWREENACVDQAPKVDQLGASTRCEYYGSCAEDVGVGLCTTMSPGSGHNVYHNVDDIDLARVAWDFMKQYALPSDQ